MRGWDSNPEPAVYETAELPLLHPAVWGAAQPFRAAPPFVAGARVLSSSLGVRATSSEGLM